MVAQRDLDELIIFPLQSVVLFPNTHVPLLIFEARYRAMTREALDNGRPIAMALIDEDAGLDDEGRPVVHPIVGIGEIEEWEETDDGRYLILLRGVARARVETELPMSNPYRTVQATLLKDDPGDAGEIDDLMSTLQAIVLTMRAYNVRLAEYLASELADNPEPSVLINRLATVVHSTEEKQALLAEDRLERRLASVVDRVSSLLVDHTPTTVRSIN